MHNQVLAPKLFFKIWDTNSFKYVVGFINFILKHSFFKIFIQTLINLVDDWFFAVVFCLLHSKFILQPNLNSACYYTATAGQNPRRGIKQSQLAGRQSFFR